MKNIALLSLVLLAAPFFAQAEIRENGGFIVPAATEINFFSPGNGIDHDLKQAVDALIESYKEAGLVNAHTEKIYGMEGETLVCVDILDFKATKEFKATVLDMIKNSERKTSLKTVPGCGVITDDAFKPK